MAFDARGRFWCAAGAGGARRFFEPPIELMDPIDPMEVADERTLTLSELSITPEFLGLRWAPSEVPKGPLDRFVIDMDLVGGTPETIGLDIEESPLASMMACWRRLWSSLKLWYHKNYCLTINGQVKNLRIEVLVPNNIFCTFQVYLAHWVLTFQLHYLSQKYWLYFPGSLYCFSLTELAEEVPCAFLTP